MNGEIDTYISGNLYHANGIFKNNNDEIIGTLSGNLVSDNMILSGNPIITYSNNKNIIDKYKS